MKKLASKGRTRKCPSNAGAVGVTPNGTPGEQAQGLPHGSNARRWIDGNGVAWTSYVTITHTVLEGWRVRRVDLSGALGLPVITTLELCDGVSDASRALAEWSHGLQLPFRDYGAPVTETQDPVTSWPL